MRVIGKSIIIATFGLLFACSPSGESVDDSFSARPKELRDCTISKLSNGNGVSIFVARCPNSDTAVSTSGKHSTHTMTINTQKEPSQPDDSSWPANEYSTPVPAAPGEADSVTVNGVKYYRR